MVRTPGAVEGGRMMARYIDADALLDRIPNPYERRAVARWVDEQPTAPVREVVLCKDCKHHWTHKCMDSMPIEECDLGQTFYDAEVDYCSLAERRQDG